MMFKIGMIVIGTKDCDYLSESQLTSDKEYTVLECGNSPVYGSGTFVGVIDNLNKYTKYDSTFFEPRVLNQFNSDLKEILK